MSEHSINQERMLSLVLIEKSDFIINSSALLASLSRLMPQVTATVFSDPNTAAQDAPLLLSFGGVTFALMAMTSPVPGNEVSTAASAAYWWPNARQEADRHRGHIVVAAMNAPQTGGAPAVVSVARLLTAVTAALCETVPGVIAALWAASQVLQSAPAMVQLARESLPANLWLDIRLFRGAGDTLGVVLRGLRPFIGRDLRLEATHPAEPAILAQRALSVAQYIMESGATLADGDTIGISADESIRIRLVGAAGEAGALLSLSVERLEVPNGS